MLVLRPDNLENWFIGLSAHADGILQVVSDKYDSNHGWMSVVGRCMYGEGTK